jgi:CRP/FNR family transcriptional regulator, cyclic AMP receptor protein
MSESSILGNFANHAFLRGLSHRHLMTLITGARPFTAIPGELIAREGDSARAFFLIQSGNVDIETHLPGHDSVRVQTVGPGEVVGWSWIVPPYRWCFDCRAVDKVQGLSLDAHWLREQCEQDYQLGYHLLSHLVEVIASRLAATRVQLLGGKK